MPTQIRLRKHVQACRNESNETEPGSREELHKLAFTVALAATLLPLPHTRQVEVSFLCAPMPESRWWVDFKHSLAPHYERFTTQMYFQPYQLGKFL